MALTYTTNDFYTEMNKLISSVEQPKPQNMTLIPNSQKSNFLQDLAPKTQGPMTVQTASGELMSVPEETPLFKIDSKNLTPTTIDVATPETTTDSAAQVINISPALSVRENFGFDRFKAIWGSTGDDKKDYNRYIKMAGYAKIGSAALNAISGIAEAYSYTQLRRDTEATKSQYETQKQIIDTNIEKTESALMENLMSNMADLDTMMAAKNVDLSSEAIAGDKAKGAMDLGKDIADMRTNGALQKAALDLEYAMNVRKAKQAEINSYVNAGLNIVGSALSLL